MFSSLRVLASRVLGLAIYIGLAFVGVVLLVWGFVFALAVIGGLLLLFFLMRLFGVKRMRPVIRTAHQSSSTTVESIETIELKRRDDGSYE